MAHSSGFPPYFASGRETAAATRHSISSGVSIISPASSFLRYLFCNT